jgi:hypothetical protein
VPIISPRDFAVRTGKIGAGRQEESGGRVRSVTLDTTDDHKIRYALFNITDEDVKLHNFDFIEKSIIATGAAFAKKILTDVLSHYVSKAGNSQALSTDKRFVAIMKAIALNKADGFGCKAIVMHYDDYVEAITEETAGGTMPWLMSLKAGTPLGSNFAENFGDIDGFVGNLFGRTPVFAVSNDSALSGDILCIDVDAAGAIGFSPGGEIAMKSEVKTILDLVENKIQAKYDIASPDDGSGLTNAVAKVTGA